MTDIEKARQQVEILSAQFNTPPPLVLPWHGKTSRANGNAGWIGIAERRPGMSSIEDTVCHEFAHILNHRRGYHGHRREFWKALVEVTTAWFGSYGAYDWSHEYVTGRKFAEASLGLSVPELPNEARRRELRSKFKKGDVVEWDSVVFGRPMRGVVTRINRKRLSVKLLDPKRITGVYVPYGMARRSS